MVRPTPGCVLKRGLVRLVSAMLFMVREWWGVSDFDVGTSQNAFFILFFFFCVLFLYFFTLLFF